MKTFSHTCAFVRVYAKLGTSTHIVLLIFLSILLNVFTGLLIDPYAKPFIKITIDLTTNIDMCPIVSTLFGVKFLL